MPDKPLTRDQAKSVLNQCLEEGEIAYSKHFRDELKNDKLTMLDIIQICKSGAVKLAPEKDIRTGHWKYRLEGITLSGHSVALVYELSPERAVFITVFRRIQ